ncbi:MAG: helix-turn-helix transcriptional regulator [Ruminococcus sp.]|nr:helix-turn-helix transcriptional regulator [Ruminococcus sp.]
MYDEQKFALRLTKLRMQKGVSARDMSLSLGQSESYINKIENGKSLPSMTGFFYICEYFGITPAQFFEFDIENPRLTEELKHSIEKLSPKQTVHVLEIVRDILE